MINPKVADKVRAMIASNPNMTAPLTEGEFSSLKEVNKTMARIIPKEDEEKLTQMGLIARKLGGLKLTTEGEIRIALGK